MISLIEQKSPMPQIPNVPEAQIVPEETQEVPAKETPKPEEEKPPVTLNWKKPIIKILIVGIIALGLMLILKLR